MTPGLAPAVHAADTDDSPYRSDEDARQMRLDYLEDENTKVLAENEQLRDENRRLKLIGTELLRGTPIRHEPTDDEATTELKIAIHRADLHATRAIHEAKNIRLAVRQGLLLMGALYLFTQLLMRLFN